ncbi:class I adenylate-forming enzyme family protein [Nonomuraea sp. NPDC050227]|uniref:class I adenylate-forming enzyme family protein n=1 Tax=Nonomuraea sp. NPDC050227 TaxID=3364360 RepID=UPI00378E5E55
MRTDPLPWTSANGIVLADRVPADVRAAWTARGLCPGLDLYSLFSRHVRRTPEREAVADETGSLDFAALDARVRRAAAALAAAGRGTADIIAVLLPNGRDAVVAELAVAAVGAVALPIPHTRGRRDIAGLLNRSRAAALITVPELALGLRAGLPYLEQTWTFGPPTPGARSLDEVAEPDVRAWRPACPDAERPARILLSSGTESEPKMVAYSHNAMAGGRGAYLRAVLGEDGPTRNLLLVSLASSYGSCGTSVLLARHGGTLILRARFDAADALRAVERHRPTHLYGVPTMLRRMADSAAEADLSSLRRVVSSAQPLHGEARQACARRFGVPLVNVYGSTDGVNCHTGRAPDRWAPGLAGTPDPAVAEITIRDAEGEPVPPGEPGEIWALGPMTPLCYVAAPDLDDRYRAPGGWVRTGDLGRLDPDGTLWVLDRIKRVVMRGGLSISPAEVERELSAHPDVADAFCVPVPDDDLGERMCACVSPRPGARPPSPAELIVYLREERGLDRRKLPERFLWLPELPLGPTGKVCAATLTRLAAQSAVPVPRSPMRSGR